MRGVTKD